MKRDPDANPMGIEVSTLYSSRANTSDPESRDEHDDDGKRGTPAATQEDPREDGTSNSPTSYIPKLEGNVADEHQDPQSISNNGDLKNAVEEPRRQKDWSELTMLEKLESLHTLAEWHFMNPTRLRLLMRSDDEYANWVYSFLSYKTPC